MKYSARPKATKPRDAAVEKTGRAIRKARAVQGRAGDCPRVAARLPVAFFGLAVAVRLTGPCDVVLRFVLRFVFAIWGGGDFLPVELPGRSARKALHPFSASFITPVTMAETPLPAEEVFFPRACGLRPLAAAFRLVVFRVLRLGGVIRCGPAISVDGAKNAGTGDGLRHHSHFPIQGDSVISTCQCTKIKARA